MFLILSSSSFRKVPSFLDPLSLSLQLLCEIGLSETVISSILLLNTRNFKTFVDWLCSESVATVFSIQFFKLLHLKFDRIEEILTSTNTTKQGLTRIPREYSQSDEVAAIFEINELHGDELVRKSYPIRIRVCSIYKQHTCHFRQKPRPINRHRINYILQMMLLNLFQGYEVNSRP